MLLLKKSVPILFLPVFLFLIRNSFQACRNPSDCDRDDCNDTLATPPEECHDHVDEMNCFRVCKDPLELLECFSEHKADDTEEYCVLKYARKLETVHPASTGGIVIGKNYTYHPGIPCSLKCRVDPVFWGCVHACDSHGCFNSFKKCETEELTVIVNNNTATMIPCNTSQPMYISEKTCWHCYVNETLQEVAEHQDCIFRYSTRISTSIPISGDDASKELARLSQLPQCIYIGGLSLGLPGVINDTAAYEDIEFCVNDLASKPTPPTTEDISECYRLRLMYRQVILCQDPNYTPECISSSQSNRTCQDRCLVPLTKPLCYLPCPRNAAVKMCKEDCSVKWPTIPCKCNNATDNIAFTNFMLDSTTRLQAYQRRVAACVSPQFGCYLDAIHNGTRPLINGWTVQEWETFEVEQRYCKSRTHIRYFAKHLAAAKRASGYNATFNESVLHFAEHFTFRECYLTDCRMKAEVDAQHCMKDCVNAHREPEDFNFICNPRAPVAGNPIGALLSGKQTIFRVEILLVCMLEHDPNRHWGFTEYLQITYNYNDYAAIYECEKAIRENVVPSFGTFTPDASHFEQIAKITYEMEEDWCQHCLTTNDDDGPYHPDELQHHRCELDNCYKRKLPDTCAPLKSLESIVRAMVSTQCYWQMDYSLSPRPYTIWSTYFDEISPHDETYNMRRPETLKYLLKSSIGASRGHYVFPYFLVIRPTCEEGYYEDSVYKFLDSGGKPTVTIKYYPTTSRQKYIDLMRAVFQGALVNLERKSREDMLYIPPNPLNRLNKTTTLYDGRTGCHLNLCYPAFLVPQILLHIPIFEVTVSNQQKIDSALHYGYTTTLHLRDAPGKGSLKVADKVNPPTADEFFPVRKVQVYEDTQYIHLWARLPDSGYQGQDGPPGPELEHLEDHNCQPYPTMRPLVGGNPHLPLDSEDFFQLQYTHGNAPQAIIAGFYDPNLVIIGDPDMRRYELVRWQFEVTGGSKDTPHPHLFHSGYPCFSHHFKVRGYVKPMYSLYDRLDPDYWIEYYRMRYSPKKYKNVQEAKAIFSAITLEDRVIFVTTSGIVTFYQNFNITAGLGKAWEVEPEDRLQKCFKIVRVAKRAHPKGDTIVAITYDYQVSQKIKTGPKKGNYETLDVSQQIWVGTYLGNAQPIKWQELTSGLTSENLKEERVFNMGGDNFGQTGDLPEQKLMGIPVERRETNPKSQIEAICYKTYRSNMGKAEYIELIEDQGWCDAVDATPVVAVDQKIQVLVRMKVYYSGGTKSFGRPKPRIVVLYVVASFTTDKTASQSSIWQIDSIIPRIPCQDEHRESIPSVVQFNLRYFRKGEPDAVKDEYGCHSDEANRREENKIFLHGMTYTRSYNHHLFLYGNKLLQSTDGGQTFVQLNSFPEKGGDYDCKESRLVYHRIKVMAFDDLGHYAFLTSKRELWYGNLGSLTQIRLRPSKAHSMVSLRIAQVSEMNEAVPFTVFFDSSNELVEMVAVVNANGTVTRIARRSINERTILRARHFISQMEKVENQRFNRLVTQTKLALAGAGADRVVPDDLLYQVYFKPLDWSVFCPFSSPAFHHNFSEKYGRIQNYFFPAPRQHLDLGIVNTKTTLYTYQSVAFNLVWNSFFNYPYRSYSFVETDPFKIWWRKKADAAVLGRLTYLNNVPSEHGILVTPDKYTRDDDLETESQRIFSTYYLDYGMIIKLVILFSIANDYTLIPIDYLHHHLDSILLNVDNANGSLIQINTEKEVLASKAAVRYVIILSVKKYTGIAQSYSGREGIQVPIKLHLIGGFGNCIQGDSLGIHGDSIATVIQVGCPPSVDLVFDWYSTLHSIKFRDIQAHYGKDDKECYKGEEFCFFARYPLVPHFHIFDSAKQVHHNFSGKYIMRIIAGGYSRDKMKSYTVEEQQAFNIPGVSDVSLIWNEWDRKFHQKVQRGPKYVTTTGRNDSREIVMEAGVSAVQWGCHTLSPCARISPVGMESIYYFKVFITNRGVDNDTLCLFEKEFVILLYGFPPSPEIQLVTSVVFYAFILTVLYIAYFCFRGHKKLWRSTTLKLYGWFQVIKETLPKTWSKKSQVDEIETEQEAQRRRDEIILSLQGHLNVPRLVPEEKIVHAAKAKAVTEEEDGDDKKLNLPTAQHSTTSIHTASSDDSKRFVIEPVVPRSGPNTWTDLIYEQIISKRLAAILERNRQREEDLKAKK